jgi:hypothetical protein
VLVCRLCARESGGGSLQSCPGPAGVTDRTGTAGVALPRRCSPSGRRRVERCGLTDRENAGGLEERRASAATSGGNSGKDQWLRDTGRQGQPGAVFRERRLLITVFSNGSLVARGDDDTQQPIPLTQRAAWAEIPVPAFDSLQLATSNAHFRCGLRD